MSPMSGNEDETTEMNVTGSPLRDDISINDIINTSIANNLFVTNPWDDVEDSYMFVSCKTARNIINDLLNTSFPKNTQGWIFILCSDENNSKTILLSHQVVKGKFVRGIGNYHGVIHHDEKNNIMKEMLKQNKAMVLNASSCEINIDSFFDLTQDITLKFSNSLSEKNCNIQHIDEKSKVVLVQRIEIGKSHLLCEDLWNQIKLLHMIKNDILESKCNASDISTLEPSYTYGTTGYEKLQEKVNQILSDVVLSCENGDDLVSDCSLESVIKKVHNRPLTEITDQLWEILKHSASYADLKKIINFIFQISSRSCIVNIPMNNNCMAELIRELSQQQRIGNFFIPRLSSTEPLELLLEIGLEKVMRDYEYIFNESKIYNLNDFKFDDSKSKSTSEGINVRKSLAVSVDLNHSANRKTLLHGKGNSVDSNDGEDVRNSKFNEHEINKSLAKMAQTHLVIEHILMIQNNLNLENDYSSIAKRMLERPLISFDKLQKYDNIEISITDNRVIQLVDNLIPTAQKIIMHAENKFRCVENVLYFNITQIIPSLIQKENESEVIDKGSDSSFHFINYSTVASKF
jgi:protein zwilch